MTEKRFTGHMNEFLTWFEDNGEKMTHTQILDTLNAQHEEIQSLKLDLEEMIEIKNKYKQESRDYSEMFDKLRIENNKQHEEITHLKEVIRRYDYSMDMKNSEINNLHLNYLKLEKENEQLKDQLKNLRRLVNEMYMEGSE